MNEETLFTLIFFALFIGATVAITCFTDSTRCSEIGRALNYKTEWHYWTGCVVEKPSGEKVLLRQMRDMEK